jgi:EAL domain-containing protein (putative c-di-GMP-specific phosphodiesterase class I)
VFIPIAEEIDVIGDLSESLIRQALSDAREWDPSLTLSVNISPVQLRDPWFAQKLLKILVDSGFPPNRLEVEITESCLHESLAVVRAIVTNLKNQGIRISLDDFGTGYSSLSYLQSLPLDTLKIDRSFVAGIGTDEDKGEIVKLIVGLALALGLEIVAEGTETAAQVEYLRELGCQFGQGYYFAKPAEATGTRPAELSSVRAAARLAV